VNQLTVQSYLITIAREINGALDEINTTIPAREVLFRNDADEIRRDIDEGGRRMAEIFSKYQIDEKEIPEVLEICRENLKVGCDS
jgi:hypothetical protein